MSDQLVPSWQFKTDGVRGYVVGGGEHGIEITSLGGSAPGTRPMCLNLEHYYARSCRNGRFVPRYKAATHSELTGDGVVRITIEPFEGWQIRTTITFELLPEHTIQACYEFAFDSDFAGFEALISNYFHEPDEPYLHVGGEWRRPGLTDHEHRFWARGPKEVENIEAIYRRETTRQDDIDLPIDQEFYDYPVMITPIRETGWSVVNIIHPDHCPSISANRRWNAHDFSFWGRDVSKGQTITCKAWLACRKLESLDEALGLYEQLVG